MQRHNVELEEFKSRVQDFLPQKAKESSEMLNLRKVEENLVKLQRFKEAQQVVDKLNEKEIEVNRKFMEDKEQLAEKHVVQFKKKQNLELDYIF